MKSIVSRALMGALSLLAAFSVAAPARAASETPVAPPVIAKVSGVAFSGYGGWIFLNGKGLVDATSVTIGGKPAAIFAKFGTAVGVVAPKLPAGRYVVLVESPSGTSVASARATLVYLSLFKEKVPATTPVAIPVQTTPVEPTPEATTPVPAT